MPFSGSTRLQLSLLLYVNSPNWFYGFNFHPRCLDGSVTRLFIDSAWLHRDIKWDISVLFMIWESYWDSEITNCWQWKFILCVHVVLICCGLAACRPSAVCNMISSRPCLVSPLFAWRKCSVRAFVLTTFSATDIVMLELFPFCFLSARVGPKFEDLNVTWNCFRQFFLIFDSTGFFFLHFTVSGLKHLFKIIRTNFENMWFCCHAQYILMTALCVLNLCLLPLLHLYTGHLPMNQCILLLFNLSTIDRNELSAYVQSLRKRKTGIYYPCVLSLWEHCKWNDWNCVAPLSLLRMLPIIDCAYMHGPLQLGSTFYTVLLKRCLHTQHLWEYSWLHVN